MMNIMRQEQQSGHQKMIWSSKPVFAEGDILQWTGGKQTMMVLTVDEEHAIYNVEMLMTHDRTRIGDVTKYSFHMAHENLTRIG